MKYCISKAYTFTKTHLRWIAVLYGSMICDFNNGDLEYNSAVTKRDAYDWMILNICHWSSVPTQQCKECKSVLEEI